MPGGVLFVRATLRLVPGDLRHEALNSPWLIFEK